MNQQIYENWKSSLEKMYQRLEQLNNFNLVAGVGVAGNVQIEIAELETRILDLESKVKAYEAKHAIPSTNTEKNIQSQSTVKPMETPQPVPIEVKNNTYITEIYGNNNGVVVGEVATQQLDTVVEATPSVSVPVKPSFQETHFGKSVIKGIGVSIVVGLITFSIPLQYAWQIAVVMGLIVFLYEFNNDPKYRFSRYAMAILSTWLLFGQLLPNIKALFVIKSTALNGFIDIVNENNNVLSVLVAVLVGVLFVLDFKNNQK